MPLLSVIVPIYNVRDYLRACLESLADQTFTDLEVVLVDDGSTDGSGQLADAMAAGRQGWRVLHVENGGLGRARNIGFDASTGDYVAFVDSDDLVPRDAYELMVHAVLESGSDLVSGGVLRFDGASTFPSPLHSRAISRTLMRTHITATPELVYDTTAWNKVYRRDFLLEHGLRAPEGVLYEDIPVTLPAHFLASSVDVLADPVYLWRERQTAEQSITQRRTEMRNLVDRMNAVTSVDDFLQSRNEVAGKAAHDQKVLTVDIPLFLDVLHDGDEEFQRAFLDLVGGYLDRVSPAVLAKLPPVRRLQYHLVGRRLLPELLEVQEFQRVPANKGRFVRQGVRLFADLPYRTDAALAIPSWIYEVTRSQPLRTGLRSVTWSGSDLVLDGHAFIHRVSYASALSAVRRFRLREVGGGGSPHRLRARRVRRPDLTALTVGAAVSYDAAGFLVTIPAAAMDLAPGRTSARYEVVAQVAARAARRGSTVGNPGQRAARHPRRAFLPSGALAVPSYDNRVLQVDVRRVPAVVTGVRGVHQEGHEAVEISLAAVDQSLDGRALYLRRTDSLHGLVVPIEVPAGSRVGATSGQAAGPQAAGPQAAGPQAAGPQAAGPQVAGSHASGTATVDVRDLEVKSTSLGDREWLLGLTDAGAAADAEPQFLLDLHPDTEDTFLAVEGRSLALRQDGVDRARLLESRPALVLERFAWTRDALRLEGGVVGLTTGALNLVHVSGVRHTVAVVTDGAHWHADVPLRGAPGSPAVRWLVPGLWRVSTELDDEGQRDRRVVVGGRAEVALGAAGEVEGVTAQLVSGSRHELGILVDAEGAMRDRGALRRGRARRYDYRVHRRLPLEDIVFFEAWKGKQYSDNPRAIYEELLRRGDPRRLVWAVSDHSVEVPEGTDVVLVGTRDYYRALGRARWVVSNDSMPPHYVKRQGSHYGQTWHGTPLKRIGFDIENLQMSNQNYLVQFAREVEKWDALVSPNAYSTDIFRRAFRFDGDVLEIGYPRNDVFHRPEEREARAAAARLRLGIPEDKRVILYAPTWRDNVYDAHGRYQFTMKLDLEQLHRAFGDDSVLLIRGHHLVQSSVDASMFGDFALNVSAYPDINDLYLLADVLVTDYSSVMFDFANTGRPMIFFAYDLESYRDDLRGFYSDFEQEAPGPVVTTTVEVVAALRDLDALRAQSARRYAAFRAKYTSLEDGHAAARFVDRFLSDSGHG
ncbi:hypothetical protein GCM10027517_02000 [Phycicoccus ginsengisoli]